MHLGMALQASLVLGEKLDVLIDSMLVRLKPLLMSVDLLAQLVAHRLPGLEPL